MLCFSAAICFCDDSLASLAHPTACRLVGCRSRILPAAVLCAKQTLMSQGKGARLSRNALSENGCSKMHRRNRCSAPIGNDFRCQISAPTAQRQEYAWLIWEAVS